MHARTFILAALAGLGSSIVAVRSAAAQNSPAQPDVKPVEPRTPRNDPALTDPSLDEPTAPRQDREGEDAVKPLAPKATQRPIPSIAAPQAAPGLDAPEGTLSPRRLYAEGSFLSVRAGTLVRARTGDIIFAPTSTEGETPEPAMVLLACQKLGQIDSALSSPGFGGRVSISGQVFVYRENHYLLPSVFTVESENSPVPSPAASPTADQPKAPAGNTADPRVEDLIKGLESQRHAPRVFTPETKAAEPAPERAGAKSLKAEGSQLIFKRGRAVRMPSQDGRLAFVFDNDANSPGPGPMLFEPCSQLESLERVLGARGEGVSLKISGRVLTYQGRNYILPSLVQVISAGEVTPRQ